jgi:NTE family protein
MDSEAPAPEVNHAHPRPRTRDGTALCLSGGGYRAMLFHVGALWRLNEAGWLPRLQFVSSVSGGSITAGVLGLAWDALEFDADGIAQGYGRRVVEPLRALAGTTIDLGAVARGLFGTGTISDRVAEAYRERLFGSATLQALPDRPRFVFNASNLQSGALWRFSKRYARDWRVGEIRVPSTSLALVVAASSAFPPFLSPVVFRPPAEAWTPASGDGLQQSSYTTRVLLTDGGVYDNLGLEPVFKRSATILVSDGGGQLRPLPRPRRNWLSHLRRVLSVVDSQVRNLRKRQLLDAYERGEFAGTYWSIRTNIGDYGLDDPLPCPHDQSLRLAAIATRLAALPPTVQERLINWGYAVCDAGLRTWVDDNLSAPARFPYPKSKIGP